MVDYIKGKPDRDIIRLARQLGAEQCIDPSYLLAERMIERERVINLRRSGNGKCRVLGIDRYSHEDWIHGDYDKPEQAVAEAERLTREGMDSASDASIETVFYAYDPEGNYLGGDVWNESCGE